MKLNARFAGTGVFLLPYTLSRSYLLEIYLITSYQVILYCKCSLGHRRILRLTTDNFQVTCIGLIHTILPGKCQAHARHVLGTAKSVNSHNYTVTCRALLCSYRVVRAGGYVSFDSSAARQHHWQMFGAAHHHRHTSSLGPVAPFSPSILICALY